MSAADSAADALPEAVLRPRRRWWALWLLPLVCLAVAGWLTYDALAQRGIPIMVHFQQGYGLKPGDAVRYRGIAVGTVREVRLREDLDGIAVDVRLRPEARELARAGSRFWIVRPQIDLQGASGLDTVVGANYLQATPGTGDPQSEFVGLETPPVLPVREPGGLEIVLITPHKGNLRPGAPVSYRQVAIGTILSVDLARDASAVEARAYVEPAYTALIRDNTRFWKTGGARFSAGFSGLSVDVDSVRGLLLGGASLAIPPDSGARVTAGRVFELHEEPDPRWLEWTTGLSLYEGGEAAPEKPPLLPATLSWRYKNWLHLTRRTERQGWVLPVPDGLLGPADLLTVPEEALPDSVRLALQDPPATLNPAPNPTSKTLIMLPYVHQFPVWSNTRQITVPEDALVIAPGRPERFLAADRFRTERSPWRLNSPAAFDERWHGAAVIATRDGALIGILLAGEDEARVARPEPLAQLADGNKLHSDVNTETSAP